jgi:hypothetical protein
MTLAEAQRSLRAFAKVVLPAVRSAARPFGPGRVSGRR